MNLYKSTCVHDVVPKQSSMYLQKIRNGSCVLFEDLWCNITNKQVSVSWAHLGSPMLRHLFVVVKVHHQIKSCWRWTQFLPSELTGSQRRHETIRETRPILSLWKSNVQSSLNFDIIRKECMHSAFSSLSGKCDVWSACAAFSMLIPDLHGILSNGKQGNS